MLLAQLTQNITSGRVVRSALTAGAIVLALSTTAFASSTQDASALRYVRAKDTGAKLFNLADKTSIVVGSVPKQGLMQVYDENSGYLSVETPGGMEVWVYGQYLRTTSVPGMVEVTGNGVFMRPLPKSDESSYPLQQQLHKGDRLRVIGRNDAAKPVAEDWIKVVSPAGTRAWVVAADTTAVDTKEDVRSAWSAAVKDSIAVRPMFDLKTGTTVAAEPKKAAGEAVGATAGEKRDVAFATEANARNEESFEGAERLYEAARSSSNPDWNGVRAAYQRYLEKNPSGTFAEKARVQLQRVELHEEIQRIQNDRSLREAQRSETLAAAEARLREANERAQDPLWGRFQARGWIVREQPVAAEAPRYVVYWSGRAQAEIVCSSGRYDLSKFADYEVGITGAMLRQAVSGTEFSGARPARVDATRIEVLGARAVK
ncbi:MAG: SH3 domain-containing protein [Planctomycetes bacterium]|nr:SH3 domain-containing protein [Planctomycetota bacterium]